MCKMADGGGIYTLGLQPGTRLHGNDIHDVYRSAFAHRGVRNNGCFVDEGSKGFVCSAKVVHTASSALAGLLAQVNRFRVTRLSYA